MNNPAKAYLVRVLNDLEPAARRFIVAMFSLMVLAVFLFVVRASTALADATLLAFCSIATGYIGQGAWTSVQKVKHAAKVVEAQAAAPADPQL